MEPSSSDNPSRIAAGRDARLYVPVAQAIVELIAAHGLQQGDRLPAEADLARRLAVSRATLREAIVALDVSGIVRLRRGASAVVNDPSAHLANGRTRQEGSPFEILDVRLMLEPEAARLAAEQADAAACDRIEAAIERLIGETRAGRLTVSADRDFHVGVAEASGNSVLAELVGDVWRMRVLVGLWPRLDQTQSSVAHRSRAVFQHMRILEAIRARDPQRAAAAMRSHIETTREMVGGMLANGT